MRQYIIHNMGKITTLAEFQLMIDLANARFRSILDTFKDPRKRTLSYFIKFKPKRRIVDDYSYNCWEYNEFDTLPDEIKRHILKSI